MDENISDTMAALFNGKFQAQFDSPGLTISKNEAMIQKIVKLGNSFKATIKIKISPDLILVTYEDICDKKSSKIEMDNTDEKIINENLSHI